MKVEFEGINGFEKVRGSERYEENNVIASEALPKKMSRRAL